MADEDNSQAVDETVLLAGGGTTSVRHVVAITVVRHGQTDANKTNIIQGHLDQSLNDLGLSQATAAGKKLVHQQFTHVYASDLMRAYQTAECIVGENAASPPSALEINTDMLLRERMYGEFQGKTSAERNRLLRASGKSLPDYTPPGAETCMQVRNRAKKFFLKLTTFLRDHLSETACPEISISTVPPGAVTSARKPGPTAAGPVTRSAARRSSGARLVATRRTSVEVRKDSLPQRSAISRRKSDGKTSVVVAPNRRTSLNTKPILPPIENKPGPQCNGADKTTRPSSKDAPSGAEQATSVAASAGAAAEQTTSVAASEGAAAEPVHIRVKASVLVVSHGGWIREFFKYLKTETNFTMFDGGSVVDKKLFGASPNTGLTLLYVDIPESKSKLDKVGVSCVYMHSRN